MPQRVGGSSMAETKSPGGSGLSWQPHSFSDHGVLLPKSPGQLSRRRVLLHASAWVFSPELGNPAFGDQDFQGSVAALGVVLTAISHCGCDEVACIVAQGAPCLEDAGSVSPQRCFLSISSLQEMWWCFEHFKPCSSSTWKCTLTEEHVSELETLAV